MRDASEDYYNTGDFWGGLWIGVFITFMVMHGCHTREVRDHIAKEHPEHLEEYDEAHDLGPRERP